MAPAAVALAHRESVCFLLTLFGLGTGRGAVSIWRQGTWELCPGPDLPVFTFLVLANGNNRATPTQRVGACGGRRRVGVLPCAQKGFPSSVPPAQLCQVSLQASANLLGSQGDQSPLPTGKGPAVSPQSTCLTVWMGWAAGLPEVDQLSQPDAGLVGRGSPPRCSFRNIWPLLLCRIPERASAAWHYTHALPPAPRIGGQGCLGLHTSPGPGVP